MKSGSEIITGREQRLVEHSRYRGEQQDHGVADDDEGQHTRHGMTGINRLRSSTYPGQQIGHWQPDEDRDDRDAGRHGRWWSASVRVKNGLVKDAM